MANELNVDAVGLQAAATSSEAVAATELSGAQVCGSASWQPSGAGVDAVNAVWASVRQRQAARITGQAADLSVSGARYDTTDEEGRDAITVTV
ncbi:hypothetical protein ACNQVK_37465 [Mycobacterium sp. 134]|uniref:hypothetical protein n=1 Tax=Mycobacterium sp. 134 TaxID=3400425 RepID=UPI003AAC3C6B